LRNVWTLTRIRMRLALRNRAFIFFSVVMPLAFLFLYAFVFARGVPQMVGYMLPAVLTLTVMGSFWGLSMQLVIFREQGILRRFRLTPIGPATMLGSSILSNYFLTVPTIAIELALAHWYFRVPSLGNVWGVFVLTSLGLVTFSSVGLIVASVTNSMQETQVINNAIWFPLLFLSGATVPFPMLPLWIQRIGLFLPATHLVTGLQLTLNSSTSLLGVAGEVFSLVAGASIAFFVSTNLFRWEPEDKVGRKAKLWAALAIVPFLLLGAWENTYGRRLEESRAILQMIQSMPAADQPTMQRELPKDSPETEKK